MPNRLGLFLPHWTTPAPCPSDIDGVATAGQTPTTVAHYLGITPTWVDGTAVGGCSFMIQTV